MTIASASCHHARGVRPPLPADVAERTVRGVVRVLGARPEVVSLQTQADGPFNLIGHFSPELARLDGALVDVAGQLDRRPSPVAGRMRSIDVREYTIDSIAGGTPVVGVLAVRGARVMIGNVPIVDAPISLVSLDRAKLWIVGRRVSGGLTVQAFGVLRLANESAP